MIFQSKIGKDVTALEKVTLSADSHHVICQTSNVEESCFISRHSNNTTEFRVISRQTVSQTNTAKEYHFISRYTLFFFYKNLVYKNIKASKCPKIKNILRTYEGFKFGEKFFAIGNTSEILRKCLNFEKMPEFYYNYSNILLFLMYEP